MEIAKIRKLTSKELVAEISKTRDQVVELQAEVAMHRIKNLQALQQAKQYFARLLTIQKEQDIIKSLGHESH